MTAVDLGAGRGTAHDDAYGTVRWSPGERFHDLVAAAASSLAAGGATDHLAVRAESGDLTYAELLDAARRLAYRVAAAGVTAGERVAVLVEEPTDAYVALLALSVLGATAVPLDPVFPDDRLGYIAADAAASVALTTTTGRDRLPAATRCVLVDEALAADSVPAGWEPQVSDPDPLAYIVYTSGSTGRPKGVMVAQSSLCNFIRVAADCYGYRREDRVYQGLTIAFDFSVEEIWVPLASGSTLVPRPTGPALLGVDLADFLTANAITAVCCVPTLLSSLPEPVAGIRLLIVSGEACPDALARTWLERSVRMLNVYGPTEATVSATWTELSLGQPVTIGVALPTYTTYVLDPQTHTPVLPGQVGELAVGGPGVAVGYVNRPDLTAAVFTCLPTARGTERVYLTGDQVRLSPVGTLEYLGRIDSQIKLRGYRIELAEIEAAFTALPQVSAAVVEPVRRDGRIVDLAAFICGGAELDDAAILREVRDRLPAYMVPAYLTRLSQLPVTVAGKVDRAALPAPDRSRRGAAEALVEARTPTERIVARELAAVLDVDALSVTADFFTDLGADSLLMAAMCARLRDQPDLPPVGIRDPYAHRSVVALAGYLDTLDSPAGSVTAEPVAAPPLVSAVRYAGCALVQAAFLLAWFAGAAAAVAAVYDWTVDAGGATALARLIVGACAITIGSSLGPVAVKWLLVGRQQPGEVAPLWSARFLRWWAARTVVRLSPLGYLAGSSLQLWYLRLLGADVAADAVYLSARVPTCPDLLRIGGGAVICQNVHIAGYVADARGLRTGRIEIGDRAYVGAGSSLDIDTVVEASSELGHASALLEGQRVPPGTRYHGSPARATADRLRGLADDGASLPRRRWTAAPLQAVALLVLAVTGFGIETVLGQWLDPAGDSWARYVVLAASLSVGGYLAVLALRFAVAMVAPRIARRWLVPDRVYPRRGLPWLLARVTMMAGSSKLLTALVGDSSYAVPYAHLIGYDIDGRGQTGSSFGMEFRQGVPWLVRFGARSMASDGLWILNVDVSASSFVLRGAGVGADCYLGNAVTVPAGVSIPDNCLLATKVMVPLDAALTPGAGLLGSPAFEIPRSVARDAEFDHLREPAVLAATLRSKNRHNLATMAGFVVTHAGSTLLGLLIGLAVVGLSVRPAPGLVALATVVVVVAEIAYAVLVERTAMRWRRLTPAFHSIYDPRFWHHERMWKLSATAPLLLLDGTALKPLLWRALGMRVGRRLYDGGCSAPEKSLVTLGDGCVLGEQSTIQCHSLEDASFKSGATVIGDGCVVADRALVHYDVTVGDRATVRCDSFVMKGAQVPSAAVWSGNPAGQATPDRR